MIQRQVTHTAGTFALCSGCGREPLHIVCAGRPASDAAAGPTRHQLECNRCGHRTCRHTSLAGARADWIAAFTALSRPAARGD